MEADIRDVVGKLEDTSSEPGDLPAQHLGERPREGRRIEEGPLTDFQVGMIGGGLIGFAVGLITAALMMLGSHAKHG